MQASEKKLTWRVVHRINDVTADAWDACIGLANPFTRHGFLSALEDSGSAVQDTGWFPHHLLVEDQTGTLQACAPVYLKTHSHGEFVFDWAWADAYERAGRAYFPKLLCAVPFTPVTGPRLAVAPFAAPAAKAMLVAALMETVQRLDLSSAHVNFLDDEDRDLLIAEGFLERLDVQYHWQNDGYDSFDGFLDCLTSRKRKAIRKERKTVADSGIDIRHHVGGDITEAHWDAFYEIYRATSDRKWGPSYLSRSFFSLLTERLGEAVLLILATRNGATVAGALNLRNAQTLWGRNWGSTTREKFLHFEVCYYQAIEFALNNGLKTVEAGAQGPHKISRGYVPTFTRSAHWLADGSFRSAIRHYLKDERQVILNQCATFASTGPFRSQ